MKPVSESAKIRGPYFSTFIRDLFEAAQANLNRKDFEAIDHLFELGCLHLRRASSVAEKLGCVFGDDDEGLSSDGRFSSAGWFDKAATADVLFLLHNTMDVALGLIETATEAGFIADHYEEHRAMHARKEGGEERPSACPVAKAEA
jgi:hypothetical protein